MTGVRPSAFTLDFLDWLPWLPTVDEAGVPPEQRTRIDEVVGHRKGSPYYEVLAHDLDALRTRTALFSDIFETKDGVDRAERELAATAASRDTSCIYCASVHSRTYANLSKKRDLVQQLLDEGVETDLPEYESAIVALSVKLNRDPESITEGDLQPLRDAGLDDEGILDIAQSAAIFANANRLMLSLGEPRTKD